MGSLTTITQQQPRAVLSAQGRGRAHPSSDQSPQAHQSLALGTSLGSLHEGRGLALWGFWGQSTELAHRHLVAGTIFMGLAKATLLEISFSLA